MTTNRTYPYTAWTLQPSFKPVEIVITAIADTWGMVEYDKTAVGKRYHTGDLFKTKAAAIAEGRRRLDKQQADLDLKAANLAKRRAALDKAEASK